MVLFHQHGAVSTKYILTYKGFVMNNSFLTLQMKVENKFIFQDVYANTNA